jgi:hypothetical protein
MSTKICNRCSNDLELELFNKKKSGVLCKNCIECNKIISANKRKNIKNKKEDIEQYTDTVIVEDEEGNITIPLRKCSCCFRTIVIWAFTQQGTTYTKQCTECLLKHKKQKKYKLTDTKVQQNTKICNRCCIVKPLVDFKETKKGIQKQCEECCIKYKLLQQQQKAEDSPPSNGTATTTPTPTRDLTHLERERREDTLSLSAASPAAAAEEEEEGGLPNLKASAGASRSSSSFCLMAARTSCAAAVRERGRG